MSAESLDAFRYLTADKAPLYRAIMRIFTTAKARFTLHLRPAEVARSLAEAGQAAGEEEVEGALKQLRSWGNLESHQDTSAVATIAEFYRARYLYELTARGESAEHAVAVYEDSLERKGELQLTALADVRVHLKELLGLARTDAPDVGKVHRTLRALFERFEELVRRAQSFVGSLQRTIDLHGIEVEAFLAYKETLIDYLERFVGELVLAKAEVAATLRALDEGGVAGLLDLAAAREVADALEPTEADRAAAATFWRERWDGLRAWFLPRGGEGAQADALLGRARAAIPALLAAAAGINDRRSSRSDRAADLRQLARWFAETDTDAQAHRLWRAAFALAPARHLRVTPETLDAWDQAGLSARTRWRDAPPVRLAPRLRRTGRTKRRGPPQGVIDRSAAKAQLAAAEAAEAEQLELARRRLARGERVRLSDLAELDPRELSLLLDLLGQALARKRSRDDVVETTSSDGALEVVLEPTGDGAEAVIRTSEGDLRGPDHYLTVRDPLAAPTSPAAPPPLPNALAEASTRPAAAGATR